MSGAINGIGETFKSMVLTLLGICACRILWITFALPLRRTLRMVILSYPVSWIVTSILFIILYRILTAKKLSDTFPKTA